MKIGFALNHCRTAVRNVSALWVGPEMAGACFFISLSR